MSTGRYVVERHGTRWGITDLAHDANKPRWTHPTEQLATEHVAHLERAAEPKPRQTQGALFDTQEVAP